MTEDTPTKKPRKTASTSSKTPDSAKTPATVDTSSRSAAASVATRNESTPTTIVLQWLTYSLWFWVLAALGWSLSATLAYFFVDDSGQYDYMTYLVAALVVLLPIAFVADLLYSRRDPAQKHGFAAVVMVLNAVVVFLAALAAIIVAVVSALSLALHPETSTGATVAIISSGVVAVLALLLFARIISGGRLKLFAAIFPWLILIVAAAGAAAAVAGPIRHEFIARTDRLIEANLPNLAQAIQDSARQNGALPKNLNELHFTDYTQDAQILIDRKLVTYRIIKQPQPATPGSTTPLPAADSPASTGASSAPGASETAIYPMPPAQRDQRAGQYELCVTYRLERQADDGRLRPIPMTGSVTPSTFIDTTTHPSGKQCYQQIVYSY